MTSIVELMGATVRLEQPIAAGQRVTGTGFVVTAPDDKGAPRLILVTADHVLARMSRQHAQLGLRNWSPEHGWRYAPVRVRIRAPDGDPLWTKHPTQDVSALELPLGLATGAVPVAELPGEQALARLRVLPGDEMMVLGYPQGISANKAGFPILRSGKVASYPLSPADRYPSYLVDFDVFAGNSGGPVYIQVQAPDAPAAVVITGLLTQQIKYRDQRLAIGNVTQADFISETISLMDGVEPAEVSPDPIHAAQVQEPATGAHSSSVASSPADLAWRALLTDLSVWARRRWIVARDWWLAVWTPAARRIEDLQDARRGRAD